MSLMRISMKILMKIRTTSRLRLIQVRTSRHLDGAPPRRPDYSEMTLRWETDEDSSANGRSGQMKRSDSSKEDDIAGVPKTSIGTRGSFPF